MNEINLNPNCKICKLSKTNPEIFREIHIMVNSKGLTKAVVCKWLNERIKVINASKPDNEKIPAFNKANFTKHFNSHVKIESRTSAEVKKVLNSSLSTGKISASFTEQERQIANEVVSSGNNMLDEYNLLYNMIVSIEQRIRDYDKWYKEKRKSSNYVNLNDIKVYQDLVSGLINAKHNLAKLRSHDNIGIVAVATSLEMLSKHILGLVSSVSDEVSETVYRETSNEQMSNMISTIVRTRFSVGLDSVVEDIINKIKKDFKV